jgi:succinate dehydrogenase/fumarate reductase flavoprotein subunit
MSQAAGPVRDAAGLEEGLGALGVLQDQWDKAASGGRPLGQLPFADARTILETRSLLVLGPAVLRAALARTSSLGAHHRSDSV